MEYTWYCGLRSRFDNNFFVRPNKKTLASGNADHGKNLHPGGRKLIFFNRFSGDVLFSSLDYLIPPENIRKSMVFWCFHGVSKVFWCFQGVSKEISGMKWVKHTWILQRNYQRISTEGVIQRCSVKKMFLEISQNPQKNTCARASSLTTLQASGCLV